MQQRRVSSAVSLRAWLAACFVVLGALRIIATSDQLSETVDEVAHIGAGMEWLAQGRYTFEVQHPPLARIAAAAGPYLLGIREQNQLNAWDEGRRILYADNAYLRNLTAARLGILPFFFLAAFFVWRIARDIFGPNAALGAVACFTAVPPVLAHFGVATTDGPFVAMFAAAVYAFLRWFATPTIASGLGVGVATGLALTTKLSALPYLGVTFVLIAAARVWSARDAWRASDGTFGGELLQTRPWSWRRAAASLVVAALAAFLVAWATYRFSIGTIRGIPVPAPEIPKGMRDVASHNKYGHPAYFLGQVRSHGVWYFFPVMLALKTPLAVLGLALAGFVVMARRAWHASAWAPWIPFIIMIAILGIGMTANINIGVRHVLPVYIALAVATGVAWEWAWRRWPAWRSRAVLVSATAVLSVGTATIHPDYLSYFNVLAGTDPSRLVADSDLDWGQDMLRLARVAREQSVDTLRFAHISTGDLSPIIGVPVVFWDGTGRPSGWIAVGETWYRRGQIAFRRGRYELRPYALHWLDSVATPTRVGKGIRLYRVPADAAPAPERR